MTHTPEQAAILMLLDRLEVLEDKVERLMQKLEDRAARNLAPRQTRVLTAQPPKGWKPEVRP
jgi:hypothetical protein